MTRGSRNPLQPFSFAVRFVFGFLVVATVGGFGYAAFTDRASFLGVGDTSVVCAHPEVRFAGGEYEEALAPYWNVLRDETVKPGSELLVERVRLCDLDASPAQGVLEALTGAPSYLLYLSVFFLFFRLVRAAEKNGPFHPLVAGRLRTLGWTLIVGGYLAEAVRDAAEAALANTFVVPGTALYTEPGLVLWESVLTLPIANLLAGLGLLTLARIMRIGARMHEDLAGTV